MDLAVFDLDGTVTKHDTFARYVAGFLRRRPLRALRLIVALPSALPFLVGGGDRGELKSAVIRGVFGGLGRATVDAWTREFVASRTPDDFHAAALEALATHRRAGLRTVLLSASPNLYVPALAAKLGFDECVCTEVRWDGERLVGTLVTQNRRGEEKARCLVALRERHAARQVHAYGNTAADLPHLRLAEHGVLVNAGASTRTAAGAAGIECAEWE